MGRSEEATLIIKIKDMASSGLSGIKSALGSFLNVATATATSLLALGAAAVASYKQEEAAINSLNQSMVQQGMYTAELSKKYQDMAAALQKSTTFSDDSIIAAQSQLQSFVGQREVTEDLVKATLNLAAAKKMDLSAAAELVGKTIGTSTNALARQGVELQLTGNQAERTAQVIDALNGKFGGQAEAAAKGYGGLEQLKNVLGDVLDTIGKEMAPIIGLFTQQLSTFTAKTSESTGVLQGMRVVIDTLAGGFVVIKNVAMGLAEVIGTGLAAAVESVSLLTQGEFTRAKEVAALGMDEMKTVVTERAYALSNELDLIAETRALNDQMRREQELAMEQQSSDRKAEMKISANKKIFTDAQVHAAKMLGVELKNVEDLKKLEEAKVAARANALSTITTLTSSNNKLLAGIGKAAALTQLAIDGPVAVGKALAAFPPPFNFVAAGAVGAAMAAQTARVMGVQLADGGIVQATPGGIQATIGEGGRDEAVIPLDGSNPMGGTTVNFNGPILGDESQARQFAQAIDRELLKLRRSNESVSFDSAVV